MIQDPLYTTLNLRLLKFLVSRDFAESWDHLLFLLVQVWGTWYPVKVKDSWRDPSQNGFDESIFTTDLARQVSGCHYGIWGLDINYFSTPPFESTTTKWSAKDAPQKKQSFCEISKVMNTTWVVSKKRYTECLAPKLLPHAQNSSHHQFFCRFQEPMSKTEFEYLRVLLQCVLTKKHCVSNFSTRTAETLKLSVSVFLRTSSPK